jgi:Domain of unknown function (DUF1835)
MSREFHIAPGTSAAGCMRQALHPEPGCLLVNQDFLSCGPLPRCQSLHEWRHVREEYLRSLYSDCPDFSFTSESDLLTNAQILREATSILLWIGTGTAEQLLLAWMVQLLRAVDVDPSRLRVIQFAREPTKGFEVVGLGVLNPDQFRAHPADSPLTKQQIGEIDAAWSAVTAGDPEALMEFLSTAEEFLPFLRGSLKALVFRFPAVVTGLNCWEEQLLRYTHDRGPVVARVIGYTMAHDMEHPDWVGDAYLFARLRRLADLALLHPFLSLTGSTLSVRGSEVTLTEAGAGALAGEANFVNLNGIDDWIGGVHLESRNGNVWFRRGDTVAKMDW